MAEATRDDADLLLRLYDMRREETMRRARAFMMQEFYAADSKELMKKYPPGSEMNAWFRQTTSYWDMVGALVKRGLLNADLLFETAGEYHILWVKVQSAVAGLREERGMPYYLKNLEDLAAGHKAFMETRAPGSSAFFAGMNRPPA